MTRRYFVPELPTNGGQISLPDPEAAHAIRVMRVRVDQEISLFDGRGNESQATIVAVDRRHCHCVAAAAIQVDRELPHSLVMGIALPKPDRCKELIERLTEIGVSEVWPLVAQRSQRPPSDTLLEKLRRTVIEACKQSGRNRLLTLHPSLTAVEFFTAPWAVPTARLIAHPGPPSRRDFNLSQSVVAAIGPEGGWTEEELQIAHDNGYTCLHLGKRIYRIETAATVIASIAADAMENQAI
ncbi:MAG: RsmE family RNA methyltransferase [Planctomycetota bacterium]